MENTDGLDILTADLSKVSFHKEAENFIVQVKGDTLRCNRALLKQNSNFFEKFFNFEPDKISIALEGGVVDFASLCTLVHFWKTSHLHITAENAQELLRGATYLQSSKAEAQCIDFLRRQMCRENAFRLYRFAAFVAGSADLQAVAKEFIETTFCPVLHLLGCEPTLDRLLAAKREWWKKVLTADIQVCEELLFHALLGWIEDDFDKRKHDAADLFASINFCLMSKSCLEQLLEDSDLLSWFPDVSKTLQQSIDYHNLTVEQQVSFWEQRKDVQNRRWPKVAIAYPTGNFHLNLECLDLRKIAGSAAPSWKRIARKTSELRWNSTGGTAVYHHPRIYFLGGENRWKLTYYDLDKGFGVAQGLPPERLLSGACVLGDKIYLIGGVSIEDWGSGSRLAVTSSCVDCYNITTSKWEGACPLTEGRSSPSVAVFGGSIFLFGGLHTRDIMTNCYRYSPKEDDWTELERMPRRICYAAAVVDEERGGIWLLGGKDENLEARGECYFYHVGANTWTQGPDLLIKRQAAFAFIHTGSLYVCGGSTTDLNYVSTTEVLRTGADVWERSSVGEKSWKCRVFSFLVKLPLRWIKTPP